MKMLYIFPFLEIPTVFPNMGLSPLESSGVHMEYQGDRQDLKKSQNHCSQPKERESIEQQCHQEMINLKAHHHCHQPQPKSLDKLSLALSKTSPMTTMLGYLTENQSLAHIKRSEDSRYLLLVPCNNFINSVAASSFLFSIFCSALKKQIHQQPALLFLTCHNLY